MEPVSNRREESGALPKIQNSLFQEQLERKGAKRKRQLRGGTRLKHSGPEGRANREGNAKKKGGKEKSVRNNTLNDPLSCRHRIGGSEEREEKNRQ